MISTNSRLRLGLLTTLNKNIGDDFIRLALVHVVQKLSAGRPLELVAIDKHEPHTIYPYWHPIRQVYLNGFRPRRRSARARSLMERWLPPLGFSRFDHCDVVLQCGTPIIWEDCRKSEWARLVWRDVLARLARRGKAVLNLGGGSCYPWERRPATLIGNVDESFVRLMLEGASITTVRDTLTWELFASLGYETRQLCCPAILVGQIFTTPAVSTRKVLINYMDGGGHYDWGQGIKAGEWERVMREVTSQLRKQGWQPILLAHNESELTLAAQVWPELPRVRPTTTREYFDLVRDAAFGVFNRMHASVAAAGLGVPSVAIGTDSRNLMVGAIGLPVFYVKEVTAQRLLATIGELLHNRDAESRRLLALRERTFSDYTDCVRPFLVPAGLKN